jgi:glycosyltransferase involved in cell wall biosynthesis
VARNRIAGSTQENDGVLVLFPFLVVGSLPLAVMRELQRRGMRVTVARYLPKAVGYTMDDAQDFAATGNLIDMYNDLGPTGVDTLEGICTNRKIGLVVQVGSPWAYAQIARLKERLPHLKIVDMLYNTGPHFQSFMMYGPSFDAVVVESRSMVELLAGGPHGAAVKLVESGVNLGEFKPGARAKKVPSGDFTVGYLGRLSPEKNPIGFVQLAEQVNDVLPWVRFVIFGQGPQEAEVRARVEQSRAREAIRLGGFVDHTTDGLAQIDCLSVPSILDGRPATVMEASACGVPVIAAPVGGIPDLIDEGQNGYLARPQDVQRHVELLSAWRENPDSFKALRKQARQVAEDRFNRERMMDRYHEVVSGVLKGPARPLGTLAA